MPVGKVRWFDAEKGFGFVTDEDGGDVFVHAGAVASGVEMAPGTPVRYEVLPGRRGVNARDVQPVEQLVDETAGAADGREVAAMVTDLIALLTELSVQLRQGHFPTKRGATNVAGVLRAVADELDGGS